MATYWCSKGRHNVDAEGFTKSELKRTNWRACKECRAKHHIKTKASKVNERRRDELFNNMFFNFKGL